MLKAWAIALLIGLYSGTVGASDVMLFVENCKKERAQLSESRTFLKECAMLLNESPIQQFLEVAEEMLPKEHRDDLLAESIYQYFQQHPENLSFFETYMHDIQAYAHPTIRWSSLTYEKRVEEFLQLFRKDSDFAIFSYQINFQRGLSRGLINTYLDVVSNAFQPFSEQRNILLRTPGLFEESNLVHQKLYRMMQVFSAVAHLKGILLRIFDTLDQLGPKTHLDGKSKKADDLYERLMIFYELYLEAAENCSTGIESLKPYVHPEQIDLLRKIQNLQNLF